MKIKAAATLARIREPEDNVAVVTPSSPERQRNDLIDNNANYFHKPFGYIDEPGSSSEMSGEDEVVKLDHLWDGSSEWCICGHHVAHHQQLKYLATKTRPKCWVLQVCGEEIISDCLGSRNDNWTCPCKFFNPYHLRGATEQFTGLDEQN